MAHPAHALYAAGDFTQPETFRDLKRLLAERPGSRTIPPTCCFYLAVADRFFRSGDRAARLRRADLSNRRKAWRRVIVEKPFGHDPPSHRRRHSNTQILKVLSEDPSLSDRSFPRQGNGPETFWCCDLRKLASSKPLWKPRPCRPCADHGSRDCGCRGVAAGSTDRTGAAAGHGAEPTCSNSSPMIGMEARRSRSMPTRCAPKKTELFEAVHSVSPENASKYVASLWRRDRARTKKFRLTGTNPTLHRISGIETMWRSSSASTIGDGLACRSICALASALPGTQRPRFAVQFRPSALCPVPQHPRSGRLPANILTLRIQPRRRTVGQFSAPKRARLRNRDRRCGNGFLLTAVS